MDLTGVFPPIPTPFSGGEFDPAALRHNLERWLATGLRGIVVLGTNGEAGLLDDEEADRVVRVTREVVPRNRPLIVGTGRQSTRAAIAATKRAAEAGADAVLVRTPSLFRSLMTSEALVRFYTEVADRSPVPVLLYNFAAATGVDLRPGAVAALAQHPNIVGLKESSGDVGQLAEEVSLTPTEFAVCCGSAPMFYASLLVGAVGGILALACVVPDLCVRLYEQVAARRLDEALELQRRLVPLARTVTITYGVPGLKAALDQLGYIGRDPRPPLRPAPPEALATIRRQLDELGVPAA